MKYSDEELAEAAVLLAHTKESAGLSASAEAALFAKGSEVVAAMRHSTTRGAAMELGDSFVERREPSGGARFAGGRLIPLFGWAAAAAAAAMIVYGLRRPTERAVGSGLPIRENPIELKDSAGSVLASLDVQSSAGTAALLSVKRLPAAPAERYQLWIAKGDGVIRPVGFFGCDADCVDVTWRVKDAPPRGELRHVWITRSATEARAFGIGTQVMAEARPEQK